jgi:hypothetical protein
MFGVAYDPAVVLTTRKATKDTEANQHQTFVSVERVGIFVVLCSLG